MKFEFLEVYGIIYGEPRSIILSNLFNEYGIILVNRTWYKFCNYIGFTESNSNNIRNEYEKYEIYNKIINKIYEFF